MAAAASAARSEDPAAAATANESARSAAQAPGLGWTLPRRARPAGHTRPDRAAGEGSENVGSA